MLHMFDCMNELRWSGTLPAGWDLASTCMFEIGNVLGSGLHMALIHFLVCLLYAQNWDDSSVHGSLSALLILAELLEFDDYGDNGDQSTVSTLHVATFIRIIFVSMGRLRRWCYTVAMCMGGRRFASVLSQTTTGSVLQSLCRFSSASGPLDPGDVVAKTGGPCADPSKMTAVQAEHEQEKEEDFLFDDPVEETFYDAVAPCQQEWWLHIFRCKGVWAARRMRRVRLATKVRPFRVRPSATSRSRLAHLWHQSRKSMANAKRCSRVQGGGCPAQLPAEWSVTTPAKCYSVLECRRTVCVQGDGNCGWRSLTKAMSMSSWKALKKQALHKVATHCRAAAAALSPCGIWLDSRVLEHAADALQTSIVVFHEEQKVAWQFGDYTGQCSLIYSQTRRHFDCAEGRLGELIDKNSFTCLHGGAGSEQGDISAGLAEEETDDHQEAEPVQEPVTVAVDCQVDQPGNLHIGVIRSGYGWRQAIRGSPPAWSFQVQPASELAIVRRALARQLKIRKAALLLMVADLEEEVPLPDHHVLTSNTILMVRVDYQQLKTAGDEQQKGTAQASASASSSSTTLGARPKADPDLRRRSRTARRRPAAANALPETPATVSPTEPYLAPTQADDSPQHEHASASASASSMTPRQAFAEPLAAKHEAGPRTPPRAVLVNEDESIADPNVIFVMPSIYRTPPAAQRRRVRLSIYSWHNSAMEIEEGASSRDWSPWFQASFSVQRNGLPYEGPLQEGDVVWPCGRMRISVAEVAQIPFSGGGGPGKAAGKSKKGSDGKGKGKMDDPDMTKTIQMCKDISGYSPTQLRAIIDVKVQARLNQVGNNHAKLQILDTVAKRLNLQPLRAHSAATTAGLSKGGTAALRAESGPAKPRSHGKGMPVEGKAENQPDDKSKKSVDPIFELLQEEWDLPCASVWKGSEVSAVYLAEQLSDVNAWVVSARHATVPIATITPFRVCEARSSERLLVRLKVTKDDVQKVVAVRAWLSQLSMQSARPKGQAQQEVQIQQPSSESEVLTMTLMYHGFPLPELMHHSGTDGVFINTPYSQRDASRPVWLKHTKKPGDLSPPTYFTLTEAKQFAEGIQGHAGLFITAAGQLAIRMHTDHVAEARNKLGQKEEKYWRVSGLPVVLEPDDVQKAMQQVNWTVEVDPDSKQVKKKTASWGVRAAASCPVDCFPLTCKDERLMVTVTDPAARSSTGPESKKQMSQFCGSESWQAALNGKELQQDDIEDVPAYMGTTAGSSSSFQPTRGAKRRVLSVGAQSSVKEEQFSESEAEDMARSSMSDDLPDDSWVEPSVAQRASRKRTHVHDKSALSEEVDNLRHELREELKHELTGMEMRLNSAVTHSMDTLVHALRAQMQDSIHLAMKSIQNPPPAVAPAVETPHGLA